MEKDPKEDFESLPEDVRPKDEESQDEWLDRLFPQGANNTVEWLCYCLSPYQAALIWSMLELNASDLPENKQGSYRQRQQKLWKAMLEADDAAVNQQNIKSARRFVNEHQLF